MAELANTDLQFLVRRIPRDILDLLKTHRGILFLGGGWIRATIAGEEPADIDLFGASKELLETVSTVLVQTRSAAHGFSKRHVSPNAITVSTTGRLTVQFITRWLYETAEALGASFDFTVCQAVIWRDYRGQWCSWCADSFYSDLAAKRLVYTMPVRDEEAGGSLLRAIKYTKRGYNIQVLSLAAVVDRLVSAIDDERLAAANALASNGQGRLSSKDVSVRTAVLAGLLREVDPSTMIDGLDILDDEHNTE